MHSKANQLTLGCGEGKYSIYCRTPSKSRQLVLKRPELHAGFQEQFLKAAIKCEVHRVPDQLVDVLLIGWW